MQEQNEQWQAPPPPEKIEEAPSAEMSEPSTLAGIFFEPGRTFEDLAKKPRFIFAIILSIVVIMGYSFGLQAKFGEEGLRRAITEAIDRNPQTESLSAEQKQGAVDMQLKFASIGKYVTPVVVLIMFLIGGLLYWLAGKAFGGSGGFLHGLSVWTYSGLPPLIVSMVGSFIVMAFKSADEIDLATSQRGLITANPSVLVDGTAHPVLATILGTFDVFMIWGWVLAAIGLRITNRISSSSAWAIVLIFAGVSTLFRLGLSLVTGTAN